MNWLVTLIARHCVQTWLAVASALMVFGATALVNLAFATNHAINKLTNVYAVGLIYLFIAACLATGAWWHEDRKHTASGTTQPGSS
jgi:hypothetical protein